MASIERGEPGKHGGARGARRQALWARLLRVGEGVGLVVLLLAVWATALSLPGSAPQAQTALASRQRLDGELRHAESGLGVPSALLAPIIAQEQTVRAAERAIGENDQVAASDYSVLSAQTRQVEQTANITLHDDALGNAQLLQTALATARAQRLPYVYDYQARLETLEDQLAAAQTIRQNAAVDAALAGQLNALRDMGPAFAVFLRMQAQLAALRAAGAPSPTLALGEAAWASDAAPFRAGATAPQYAALISKMQAQMQAVSTTLTQALLTRTTATLGGLQPSVAALQAAGDPSAAATLQSQLAVAAQALALTASPSASDTRTESARAVKAAARLLAAHTLVAQLSALQMPLLRLGAQRDVATLTALVAQAQRLGLLDPFNGRYYPAAYAYADAQVGYPHVAAELNAAQTPQAILLADDDARVMSASVSALMADLRDKTPAAQPHAADLRLLQQMGLTQGKVIVISTPEQVIRFYDNGKLVNWSYVTTGRPELPSPPGLHFAVSKASPVLFTSPEPRSSPLWFEPTPVNYAILYANGDDFIHDAWWRNQFGPGTQLPHYDPIAFNGGSHGCVNLPLKSMQWVYQWTPVGAPTLLY